MRALAVYAALVALGAAAVAVRGWWIDRCAAPLLEAGEPDA